MDELIFGYTMERWRHMIEVIAQDGVIACAEIRYTDGKPLYAVGDIELDIAESQVRVLDSRQEAMQLYISLVAKRELYS